MDAIFPKKDDNLSSLNDLARPYLGGMVSTRQVQQALRALMGTSSPEEFADEAGVDRATVYRIVGTKTYSPRIETIAALAQARGLSLSAFFLQIEGLPSPAQGVTDLHLPPRTHEAPNEPGSLSAADATTHVNHVYVDLIVTRLALAIERLVDTRAQDRHSQSPQPHDRRRAKGAS